MLVISRYVEESVRIGSANVKILSIRNGKVRLGIEAPPDVEVVRDDAIKTRRIDRDGDRKTAG